MIVCILYNFVSLIVLEEEYTRQKHGKIIINNHQSRRIIKSDT